MKYLLINKDKDLREPLTQRVTLEAAAQAMELDPAEIEWCIEEYNRCDCGDWILIKEEYEADKPI